jgi:hypothetical protein
VTSAAMVAGFYGIRTDPQRLNTFLTKTGGFTGVYAPSFTNSFAVANAIPEVAP